MSFRSSVAAALLAVGVGQAADAATVYDVVFTLKQFSVFCSGGCELYPNSDPYRFAGLKLGQSALGRLTVEEAASGGSVKLTLTYGDELKTEMFRRTLWETSDGSYLYNVALTPNFPGYGSDDVVRWDGTEGFWYSYPDAGTVEKKTTIAFEIAPVPLPATAALLPLGIGALAMVRKRRRVAA